MAEGMERDWGKGIPDYRLEDVISHKEVQELGAMVACDALKGWGFEITQVQPQPGRQPAIAALKEGEQWAICLQSQAGKVQVELQYPDLLFLVERLVLQGYRVGFLDVILVSMDEERGAAELALAGDRYGCKDPFMGEVTGMKAPGKGEEDFLAYRLHLLGKLLARGDGGVLKEALRGDCIFSSHTFPQTLNGRGAVVEHLFSLPEVRGFRRCAWTRVVRLIGKPPMVQMEHVVMNGRDEGSMMVMNDYRVGTPALRVGLDTEEGVLEAMLVVELDEEGLAVRLGLEYCHMFEYEEYWK